LTEILLIVIAIELAFVYFAIDECRRFIREIRKQEYGEERKKAWREKWDEFCENRKKGGGA
jgi:hypothetical protein